MIEGQVQQQPLAPDQLAAPVLLVLTVLGNRSEQILTSNIRHLSDSCASVRPEWAVVTYEPLSWELPATVHTHLNVSAATERAKRAKGAHQRTAIAQAAAAGLRPAFVWTLDEDISLAAFDCEAFWALHRAHRPVIAQPTIATRPNQPWQFAPETWRSSALAGAAGAAPSLRNIEQMASLFEMPFLSWLYEQPVVGRVLTAQLAKGSAWGLDQIWCGAARQWLDARGECGRAGCRVLPVPVAHMDMHTLAPRGKKKYAGFVSRGFALLHRAGLRQPLGACWGKPQCATHEWFCSIDQGGGDAELGPLQTAEIARCARTVEGCPPMVPKSRARRLAPPPCAPIYRVGACAEGKPSPSPSPAPALAPASPEVASAMIEAK